MSDISFPRPVSIRCADIAAYLGVPEISKDRIIDLRAKGQWPTPSFYIANDPHILLTDLDAFIERRRAALVTDQARLKERSRKANAARWGKAQRVREAA